MLETVLGFASAHPAIVASFVSGLVGALLKLAMSDAFLAAHPFAKSVVGLLVAAGFNPDAFLVSLRDFILSAIGQHPIQKAGRVAKASERGLAAIPVVLCLAAIAVVCAFASGCAGSFEEARLAGKSPSAVAAYVPSLRCTKLDNAHRAWGFAAVAGTSLAGASGLATIPVDNEARPYTAGATVVLAAGALGAKFVEDDYATAWARECQ